MTVFFTHSTIYLGFVLVLMLPSENCKNFIGVDAIIRYISRTLLKHGGITIAGHVGDSPTAAYDLMSVKVKTTGDET